MSALEACRPLPRLIAVFACALIGLVALGLTLPVPVDATAGAWERIGLKEVSGQLDHDVLPVTVTEGRFQKIQLRVARASMEIFDLRVHFGDGTVQDVALRSHLSPGSSSRIIDLDGGDRVIRKLDFTYGNVAPGRRPARLVVWGMH